MKKIIGIVLAGLLYCNIGFAEIIFKNCDLSPNTGQSDFYIYLEKNEMEMRDETGDIRIFAIDNNEMSEVTVSRLIAFPSDKELYENYSKHEQNLYFNYMNDQMDERYTLNYNTGNVKQVFKAHSGADKEYLDMFSKAEPYLEANCRVVNLYKKQEKKVSTNQSNKVSITNLTKKQKKLYSKYMSTPEIELCIRYINNYGWFDDQTVRFMAVQNRGLNCSQYEKLASDEEKRRNNVAEAGKKLLDGTVDSVYDTNENSSGNKRTHCTTTDIGGTIQVFCKEY